MTQFEQYRWEDRVLRNGSWKLNLAVGAVAFAVLAGACLDSGGRSWAARSSLPQSGDGTSITELGVPGRAAPASMRGAMPEYLDRTAGAFWLMNTERLAM
jgi:hypothetical protein